MGNGCVFRRGKPISLDDIGLTFIDNDYAKPIFYHKRTFEVVPTWAVMAIYQLECKASVSAFSDYLYQWNPDLDWSEVDYKVLD